MSVEGRSNLSTVQPLNKVPLLKENLTEKSASDKGVVTDKASAELLFSPLS